MIIVVGIVLLVVVGMAIWFAPSLFEDPEGARLRQIAESVHVTGATWTPDANIVGRLSGVQNVPGGRMRIPGRFALTTESKNRVHAMNFTGPQRSADTASSSNGFVADTLVVALERPAIPSTMDDRKLIGYTTGLLDGFSSRAYRPLANTVYSTGTIGGVRVLRTVSTQPDGYNTWSVITVVGESKGNIISLLGICYEPLDSKVFEELEASLYSFKWE